MGCGEMQCVAARGLATSLHSETATPESVVAVDGLIEGKSAMSLLHYVRRAALASLLLPSPLLFLAHVAAQTRTIRLGTAIITLPMENALRVAEDAAVLDLLADGRLEIGLGSGGTPDSFLPFGLTFAERGAAFADHLHTLLSAWRGDSLGHPDNHLYPAAPQLAGRVWIATFSVEGAIRAELGRRSPVIERGRNPRRSGRPWPDAVPHPAAPGGPA